MSDAGPDDRPFVGRAAERRTIAAHVAAVREGGGRVVLVSGEAGIGKTRLVEETVASLPRARVLWGLCHEGSVMPAFWPWAQALRRYAEAAPAARLRTELARAGGSVARLVPYVRTRVPEVAVDTLDGPDPEAARFQLFDGVKTFLRAIAEEDLLAIVLDDLHWADAESLLLLRFLAPELRGTRLLVLGTYRDWEMRRTAGAPRLLTALARTSHTVRLDGFDESDVGAYLRARAAGEPGDGVAVAIHGATAGNPFFVTQVVDLLEHDGRLGAAVGRIELPASVRDVIGRRIDPLPASTRPLLDAAAVLGLEFDLNVLARVVGTSPEAALDALGPSVTLGAVTGVAERPGRYRFVHALLRETVLASLDAPVQARLHRRAAEALEHVHASAPEPVLGEIAHHYLRAAPLGTLAEAVDRSARAGQHAYARLGFEEAAGHYARALEAGRAGVLDADARLRLLMQLGQAQGAAGHGDAARVSFVEAAQLARDRGDDAKLAAAAVMAESSGAETGDADAIVFDLLEEALRRTGPRDGHRRISLLAALARAAYFTDAERRHRDSAESLALARRVGDPAMLLTALQARHFALWEPGRASERRALLDEAEPLVEEVHPLQIAGYLGWRVHDHLEAGEMDAVHATMRRFRAVAARCRLPRVRWHLTLLEASLAHVAGRLDEAERLAERAVAHLPPRPRNNVGVFHAVQRYLIHEERGRLAELLPAVQAAAEQATHLPIWRAALTLLLATLGRRDEAAGLLAALGAHEFADLPLDGNALGTYARLAEACALLDAPASAEPVLARLAPHAETVVVLGTGAGCLGSAARYAGLLAHTLGRLDEAIAYFEAALATNARLGALPQRAHTQRELARTLRVRGASGDADRAAGLVAQAAAAATSLGLVALSERIAADTTGSRRATQPVSRPAPPALAPTATLARHDDGWLITCGDESVSVRDTKGVAYLAQLLRHPGREFHAGALGGADVAAGDAGEVLDAEARRAYKARLDELRAALAEAEEFNDLGRTTRLREEIDMLACELGRATGIGGRARRVASDVERARLNVTRAIRSVIRKVEAECPLLGRHLERGVQTGIFCAYEPDPTVPIVWIVP